MMFSMALKHHAIMFDLMQDKDCRFVPHLLEVGDGQSTSEDLKAIKAFA